MRKEEFILRLRDTAKTLEENENYPIHVAVDFLTLTCARMISEGDLDSIQDSKKLKCELYEAVSILRVVWASIPPDKFLSQELVNQATTFLDKSKY